MLQFFTGMPANTGVPVHVYLYDGHKMIIVVVVVACHSEHCKVVLFSSFNDCVFLSWNCPTKAYCCRVLLGIRECAICGALATYECKNCFREFGDGLDKISFCDVCLTKVSISLLAWFTCRSACLNQNTVSFAEDVWPHVPQYRTTVIHSFSTVIGRWTPLILNLFQSVVSYVRSTEMKQK